MRAARDSLAAELVLPSSSEPSRPSSGPSVPLPAAAEVVSVPAGTRRGYVLDRSRSRSRSPGGTGWRAGAYEAGGYGLPEPEVGPLQQLAGYGFQELLLAVGATQNNDWNGIFTKEQMKGISHEGMLKVRTDLVRVDPSLLLFKDAVTP